MEIGSEFWLDEIPSTEYLGEIPDWIEKFGNVVLTSSGRGAISLLLKEVKVKEKTALLPAYTCDSVILPFIMQGYTCYFYDINTDLTPDLESIVACGDVGIFLHMGYYGFPTNIGLSDIVKQIKDTSTVIVEDITHTLFSNYKRLEENDYCVASLRKWLGLPSGGFLASRCGDIKNHPQNNKALADIRKKALQIKANYMISTDEKLKQQYLKLFTQGEALLDSDLSPYNIDTISKTIINSLDVEQIKEKRRVNFKFLSTHLKNVEYIDPVFDDLPENICPLFFPIYIAKKRNEIRQKLIDQNIYCPIHWPLPEQIECNRFESTEKIYDTVLSIPCDQRYRAGDMERVVSVFRRL